MAYRRIPATKDSYITNKIIRQVRKKESNTGQAGTIDLFKLHDVSKSGSAGSVQEISRALIAFDLDQLRALTGSVLDITSPSFSAMVSMTDIHGGQTVPSNYTLKLFPLSRSFDEGIGRDVVYFTDIDSANFQTASFATTPSLWAEEGAGKGGLLGSDDLDYITSGNLGDGQGIADISAQQLFEDGIEDLLIDVTSIVSATIAGQIPDHGFRLGFTSSQETDQNTYFVKRFGSRHALDRALHPKLIVKYDDTLQSHEADLQFDLSGSLFLFNYDRNGLSNLVSGSTSTPITGNDSLQLRLMFSGSTGLTSSTFLASQHTVGTAFVTGVYSASLKLSSFDTTYKSHITTTGSITFLPFWESLDGTIGYHSGSPVTFVPRSRSNFNRSPRNLTVNITNMRPVYRSADKVRFRVFVQDLTSPINMSRIPLERVSAIFVNMHYSIRDTRSNVAVIPFDKDTNATLLSTDAKGMYFDVHMSDLDTNRSYRVDLMIEDNDVNDVFTNVGLVFKVES
jgi:hypothetical protein